MADFPVIGPDDLQRIKDDFLTTYPDSSDLVVSMVLAGMITVKFLGREWAQRNSAVVLPSISSASEERDEDETFAWQFKVTELAMLLYEVQALPGFMDSLPEMQTRTLRGVTAELKVAQLLGVNGHMPRLVARTGAKRQDYDIEARVGNYVIPVEVKAKEDDTPFSLGTISTTLTKARRQMPERGPGIVFLAIPSSWAFGTLVKGEVVRAVMGVLRNSRSLNAVVLLWQSVFQAPPTGQALATVFHVVEADNPRLDIPGVDTLLAGLTLDHPVVVKNGFL